jgi:hypothetical protein
MRPLILGIVLFLGVLFVINYFTETEVLLEVIEASEWQFLVLAVGLGVAWIFAYAATYWSVFRAMGLQRSLMPFVPLSVAANFMNIIAPSAGISGMAVLISDARRNKLSPAHATVAGALVVLADYTGFSFFLVAGLVVLLRRGNLTAAELTAAAFLLGVVLLLATLVYVGTRSARRLGRALQWIARIGNKIVKPVLRREPLSEEHAKQFAVEAAEGLREVRRTPGNLWLALFFSALSKSILLGELSLMFLAFASPISAGTLLAAYALAYLFVIVSPTPAGVGVVEGVLTLTLTSMFIPIEKAALVALGYRITSFWLPFIAGFISFQLLHLKKPVLARAER